MSILDGKPKKIEFVKTKQSTNPVPTAKVVGTATVDVGGLMEVIFSFFNILSSLVVSILYEESLVNNLFSFDLDKKIISLKEKHNKKNINFIHQEEPLFELKNNPNIKDLTSNTSIKNAAGENIISNNGINNLQNNCNKFISKPKMV